MIIAPQSEKSTVPRWISAHWSKWPERKQTSKSFIKAASENTEYDKVQDAMTSLLDYQLFINAFSSPLIIHQCYNNKAKGRSLCSCLQRPWQLNRMGER